MPVQNSRTPTRSESVVPEPRPTQMYESLSPADETPVQVTTGTFQVAATRMKDSPTAW